MLCPACTADMPEDDIYCEDCGAPMTLDAAGPLCPKCHAGAEEIDSDGYCSSCGFRRVPHERDHIEIELSPNMAGVSDRGRKHSSNDDYLVMRDGIIVVCDGVSSSQDAMLASKAAGDAAADSIAAGKSMQDAIADALAAVVALPVARSDADAPSTTIVAARIGADSAEIAWAGDSRAYWFGPGTSQQLTRDDSWLNEVVSRGVMDEASALASRNAHAVTKWLGRDAADLEPSVLRFEYPGDGFLLLCTDGLWNYAQTVSDLEGLTGEPCDALITARTLVEFANAGGGVDNITAAIWIRK